MTEYSQHDQGLRMCLMFEDLELVECKLVGIVAFWLRKPEQTV